MIALPLLTAQTDTQIEFSRFTLDNGLRVILHQDNSTPIVAIGVLYHVGSKNEDPNRTGFAHFFEHLLFEGSENIDRGEFDQYMQEAGGTNNAYTTQDQTYYYEVLPSNQLELGLWLESERMLHAKVEEKGIETQREVVKEEKRLRVDNQPYGSILEEIVKRGFTTHPYRWTPIGSMEHLDAASEADYTSFYETFYVPNNAVLSIAGDIDPEQARTWVEKYFATIPRGTKEIPRPNIEEPEMMGVIRDTVYDNIQLPAIIHAYRLPGQTHPDSYALKMLSTVLSQGESSRLYKTLVDEAQAAVFVANQNLWLEDYSGSLMLSIANMGVDPATVDELIDQEVRKVQEELISEREFEKVRNQMETQMVTANATMAGIAENLATYELYYGDAGKINTELQRLLSVTRQDIQRVAREYLDLNRRVVLYYLPDNQ